MKTLLVVLALCISAASQGGMGPGPGTVHTTGGGGSNPTIAGLTNCVSAHNGGPSCALGGGYSNANGIYAFAWWSQLAADGNVPTATNCTFTLVKQVLFASNSVAGGGVFYGTCSTGGAKTITYNGAGGYTTVAAQEIANRTAEDDSTATYFLGAPSFSALTVTGTDVILAAQAEASGGAVTCSWTSPLTTITGMTNVSVGWCQGGMEGRASGITPAVTTTGFGGSPIVLAVAVK